MAAFTSEASYGLQRWERALREGQSSMQDSWNAGQHGSLAVSNPSRSVSKCRLHGGDEGSILPWCIRGTSSCSDMSQGHNWLMCCGN